MKIRNSWTTGELAKLRQFYVSTPHVDLPPMFPRHPLSSIIDMAHSIGLRKNNRGGSKLSAMRKYREIAARHVPTFNFGG